MAARSAFVPVVVAEHLTWDDVVRVSANAPVLPGVIPEVGLSRFYPDGPSTSHVVGYVGPVSESDLAKIEDPDPLLQIPRFQIGKTGIEAKLEPELRGAGGDAEDRGERRRAGDARARAGRGDAGQGPAADAGPELAGLRDGSGWRGESAAAAVIDVTNGDIVALASAPGFEPNSFVFGISSAEWNGAAQRRLPAAVEQDRHRHLSARLDLQDLHGAGGARGGRGAARATASAAPASPRSATGGFHCWKHGGHGRVDLRRSLAQSCDCYYYEMGRRLGPDRISAMAHRLGLGVRARPADPGGVGRQHARRRVEEGQAAARAWTTGDSFNYGIGQGFTLASPLQLAVMVARVASGTVVKPRIVRAVDGVRGAGRDARSRSDIAPQHLQSVRDGMFAVSNEGTAFRSRIVDPAMLMAGKTGTSQVRIITAAERAAGVTSNEQLPWKRRDHALFVAYAPYDAPRYAIAQIVEHGGGGSAVAAPIARDILLYALCGGLPPLEAYPADQRKRDRGAAARLPAGARGGGTGAAAGEGPGMSVLDASGRGTPRGPAKLFAMNWSLVLLLGGRGLRRLPDALSRWPAGRCEPWAEPQMIRFGGRHGW